jgi:SagB-type dehydrogenase family enzyme
VLFRSPNSPNDFSEIDLPDPNVKGTVSLEEALQQRRSIRRFSVDSLTLAEVSQILWATQGQTSDTGGRTAPSAGALYPLETYLITGHVNGLNPGVYKYYPDKHAISLVITGDIREPLSSSALGQESVKESAVCLLIAGIYKKTTEKYGERGIRYVQMEAGHAAQNACLQVTALGLGSVTVGAFTDEKVKEVAGLALDEIPLYLIPIGRN